MNSPPGRDPADLAKELDAALTAKARRTTNDPVRTLRVAYWKLVNGLAISHPDIARSITDDAVGQAEHVSAKAMDVLLRDLEFEAAREGVGPAAMRVLAEFAMRTEEDGVTDASVRELARELGRSSGTVARQVGRLTELGFLEVLGRSGADHRRRRWRVAGMDRRCDEIADVS